MKTQKFGLRSLAVSLFCGLCTSVFAQSQYVLFQDGFENSVPGTTPAANGAVVGSYSISGNTNQIQVVTGPSVNGPSGAAVGNNYLRYDESDFATNTPAPLIQAIFTTPFMPTNQPFHVQFYLWAPGAGGPPVFADNWPQATIGSGTAVNNTSQFIYTADVHTAAWEWYNGAYNLSGISFTTNNWDFVQMDWNGTTMTGTINGNSATLGTWGSALNAIDRLMFRHAVTNTLFYVDDVKVTTPLPILVRAMQPLPGASTVSRQPVLQLQLANASQSVAAGSVQLFLNSTQLAPVVTQTNTGSDISTLITCALSSELDYGSSNTVTCVYSDQATPANLYTNAWNFTVYGGDTIFADNFEAAHLVPVPFAYSAFDGTNCLVLNRISGTGPLMNGVSVPSATSVTNDLIDFKYAFRVGVGSMGLNLGNATNITVQLNLFANGQVAILGTNGASQFLTQRLITNNAAWNTLEMQYTNASGYFSLSVNGAPFVTYLGGPANGAGKAYGLVTQFRLATTSASTTTWSDGIVMSNLTTQTAMFMDSFEQDPIGVLPATNSPILGAYSYTTATAGYITPQPGVFFTNLLAAPPNAPQGGTYATNATTALVTTGTGHGGTNFVTLTNGTVAAVFITPIPAGIALHAEAYINWHAGDVTWGFTTGGTNQFAALTLNDSYGITLFDGTNDVDTGYGHTVGIWEYYELDYVVGSAQITVTVDGNPVTIPIAPQASVTGLFFTESSAPASNASLDDVFASAALGYIPATNPLLGTTRSGNQLVFNWTNAAGYVLQQNNSLTNRNGWVNIAGGGTSPLQIPITTNKTSFYRLVKPN